MRSRLVEKTSTARSASSLHGRPRISDARTMEAAVALVYVFVALPYSGPARIGSLFSANFQHVLAGLLQISPSARSPPLRNSSTNSALSPEVVSSTESAASSHTPDA